MGWKRDSSVEVAIKLIRRETLGSNSNRLAKIYREIHILRGLDHPNIVRLHEMVETERHIGIILEYASGGELFDYILNHRYLKDGPARKLFAQLISGVGYLHKRGIVHRDLKLENLLLDRNKNIIITDFGFANTFDPKDELSEEIEYRLGDKDFIRQMGLDQPDARRGDLMQTSCGSPCYAAPELVVSDSLYTGCKVDVWSCGVILYAMLAGYLPFDDDPANPEGDNINLLYKYIVSTPLTFPEYVTPHARDLLKRILVPDPRKRADLFEVARHSWLADYAHVVGFITTSNAAETAQQGSVYAKPYEQPPPLARSASVREPTKAQAPPSVHGGLTAKRDQINTTEKPKTSRDNKRRTVQVEYVAPQSQTQRGETSPPGDATPKARPVERAPVELTNPTTDGYQSSSSARPSRSAGQGSASSQARPAGQPQRSVSDYTAFGALPAATTRPSTGGTLAGGSRMPSRGNSYAQPAAATVAPTNAEGRFSQPKGKNYSISTPYPQTQPGVMGEPSIGQPSTERVQSIQIGPTGGHPKGSHKRSNTVTETIGRMTSMFGGRQNSYTQDPKGSFTSQDSYGRQDEERKQKRYPPTSMPASMSNDNSIGSSGPRPSTDSRRRPSFSFSRKNTTEDPSKPPRRFSLLPSSFSRNFGSQRESMPADGYGQRRGSNAGRARNTSRSSMAFGRGAESRSPSQSTMGSSAVPAFYDGQQDSNSRTRHPNTSTHSHGAPGPSSAPPQQTQFAYPEQAPVGDDKFPNPAQPHPSHAPGHAPSQAPNRPYGRHPNDSQASEELTPTQSHGSPQPAMYPQGMGEPEQRGGKLQKHRKFEDAYEGSGANKGSSGSSKKVMDFFRQMGRRRAGK
ncbi:hypothetical protein C7974DRAFT_115167 [Boeremia exigua]|uniref:uncharacterized protein n=1 Tax=Boeremia exigua TaxID=749465 RepID=UPI001E8CE780|nr:uncharacterized protein C7974DRAFT_115167 [Boeremia exigua]KAH6643031.1 hypothetical protein C7974DRAFT_115167 [Boeremia exigua]